MEKKPKEFDTHVVSCLCEDNVTPDFCLVQFPILISISANVGGLIIFFSFSPTLIINVEFFGKQILLGVYCI